MKCSNIATYTSLYAGLTFGVMNLSYLLVIGSKLGIAQIHIIALLFVFKRQFLCLDLESK